MQAASSIVVLASIALLSCVQGLASPACPEEQTAKQVPPQDPQVCDALDGIVRRPSALRSTNTR